MKKVKILLTGSGGFIGKNIAEQLAEKYHFTSPSHKELDLTDFKQVSRFFKSHKGFSTVIHCASIGGKKGVIDGPQVSVENLKMFFNLISQEAYFNKMIYFGSGAEYDKRFPIKSVTEDDFGKKVPTDYYGFSKFVMTHRTLNSDRIINLRLFGVYGPYEDYSRRFISQVIGMVLFELPIVIRQNAYFDYIYIDDLVKIVDYFVVNNAESNIYNVGTGIRTSLVSIARMIVEENKYDGKIKILKRGIRNEYTCDNTQLVKEMKGFSFTSLYDGSRMLFDWYKKRRGLLTKEAFVISS